MQFKNKISICPYLENSKMMGSHWTSLQYYVGSAPLFTCEFFSSWTSYDHEPILNTSTFHAQLCILSWHSTYLNILDSSPL